jgi:hypothetical protein
MIYPRSASEAGPNGACDMARRSDERVQDSVAGLFDEFAFTHEPIERRL